MGELGIARRAEILDTAIDIVREFGTAGLTMKKVADRIGFSEAAAYKYYRSKQDLQEAMALRIGEAWVAIADEEAAREDLPPRERLRRIIKRSMGYMHDMDGLPITMLAEIIGEADERRVAIMRVVAGRYMDTLSRLLAGFTLKGDTIPPGHLSLAVVSLITGFALWRKILDDEELIAAVEQEMPENLSVLLLEAVKLH